MDTFIEIYSAFSMGFTTTMLLGFLIKGMFSR